MRRVRGSSACGDSARPIGQSEPDRGDLRPEPRHRTARGGACRAHGSAHPLFPTIRIHLSRTTLGIAERGWTAGGSGVARAARCQPGRFRDRLQLAYVRVLQARFEEAASLLQDLAASPDSPAGSRDAVGARAASCGATSRPAKAAARAGPGAQGTRFPAARGGEPVLWDMGETEDAGRLADKRSRARPKWSRRS